MRELILQTYAQFAPDVKITNEKLSEMLKYYNNNSPMFMADFERQVLNPKGIDLPNVRSYMEAVATQNAYNNWNINRDNERRTSRVEERPVMDDERRTLRVEPIIDPNIDPLEMLPEDIYQGNAPLLQDLSDIETLYEPFGFEVDYPKNSTRFFRGPGELASDIAKKVTVTAPNGATLELPFSPVNGKQNRETILEFFRANAPAKESEEYKKAMRELVEYGEYVKELQANELTQEELQAVRDKVSGIDIYERELSTAVEKTGDKLMGQDLYRVIEGDYKYQDIINEAKESFTQGDTLATKEDIEQLARDILFREEALAAKIEKTDKAFLESDMSEAEKSKRIIGSLGAIASAGTEEEIQNRIKAIENLVNSYSQDVDVKELNDFYRKYDVDNSEQLLFNLSDDEKIKYNNLRKKVAGKLFDIKVMQTDVNRKIKNLTNLPLQTNLVRRSYSDLYNLGTKLGNSFANVLDGTINQAASLPLDILAMASASRTNAFTQILNDKAIEAKKYIDANSVELQKELTKRRQQLRVVEPEIGDEPLRFISTVVAEQLPILGALYFTRKLGGNKLATATMFQLGYGLRQSEYAYEEYLNPMADKISREQKMFVSAGHGIAEALFENLVTLRLLDGTFFGRGVGNIVARSKRAGLSDGIKSYLPVAVTVPAAMGAESLSEVFTEISQNGFDGNDLLTNVDRAAWAGAIVGGGITFGSFVQGLAAAAGVDNKTKKMLFEASERLTVAQDKLNDNKDPDLAEALQADVAKADQYFQKLLNNIGEYALYNPKHFSKFQEIIANQNNIRKILNDPATSERTKTNKIIDYDINEANIDLLKKQPRSIFKVLENSPVEADRLLHRDYIKRAKQTGADNPLRVAEQLYYEDVLNENIAYHKKLVKGAYDIKIMTREQAVKFVKDNPMLDIDIAKITSGRLNGINIEGQSTGIIIKDNVMKNYRVYSIPHEIGHEVQNVVMGTDPARQKAVGELILTFTNAHLPDIYNAIQVNLPEKSDPEYYKEVYALFVEFFQQNKLDPYDYAPLWHEIMSNTMPEADWINLDEVVTFVDKHIKSFKPSSFAFKSSTQKSIEDPKGFAEKRDVINRFVVDLASDVNIDGDITYQWDETMANAVLDYAKRKKVFDSYIIGKRPNYTNIQRYVDDVYRDLIGITRTFKPNENKDANGRPDYFGWIMGNLNFKTLNVTKEYIAEQQARARTVDLEQARGIAAEIGDDTVEDYGFSQIAEDMGVQPDIIDDIRNVILTQVTNYADGLKDIENTNRDVIPFVSNIRNALTERFRLVKPFVESGNVLKMKLKKIKPIFLREVKTEYLAKNIPSLVEKQLKETGEFTSDWKGKDIARQKKVDTGKTSGPQVMRKNEAAIKAFTDEQFIEVYFPKGKNNQAKTEGLQKQLINILGDEVITNDAISYARTNDFSKAPIMAQINKSGFVYEALKDIGSGQIAQVFDRAKVNKSLNYIPTLVETKQAVIYKHANAIRARVAKGMDMESSVQMAFDEENIKITIKQLDGISQDLIGLLDQFAVVVDLPEEDKRVIAEGRDITSFTNFIRESQRMLEKGGFDLAMYFQHIGVLAKGESATNLISKDQVYVNQEADVAFAKNYIEKNGKRDYVVAYLKYWSGTTEVAGKIMNGSIGPVKDTDGNYKLVEITDGDRVGTNRAQFYKAQEHSQDMLVNNLLGLQGDARLKQVKKGNTIISYEFKDGDETIVIPREEFLLPKQTGPEGMKIPYDESSPVAKGAMDFVDAYVEFMANYIGTRSSVVDKVYDDKSFYLSMAALNSNPKGALRAGAPVRYKYIGPAGIALRYEHVIPANYILVNLIRHHAQNEITRKELDKLLSRYEVAIIPVTMDSENVKLSSVMSATYQFGDNPLFDRYYVIYNYGKKNMFAVKDTKTNDIYGQEYANATINKSKERRDDAINSQNFVVAMRRAADPNAKIKGASIIDFDDTLAKTKSNVLYTLPNGTKGKIDATEFALRSEALEAEGAVFDFSEFSQVKAGKRGPFFGKAQALKEKFGNTDIYVLTARPQNAAPAIQKFLSGVGLDLKIENIIGLENGTPEAKANWIIDLASQGYNDILFADDAIKNTKAVAEVLDKFNIGGKVYQARVNYSKEAATPEQLSDILVGNNPDVPEIKEDIDDARAKALGQPGFWLTELFNYKRKTNLVFVPPSAEDLKGLWDNHIAGKGRKGESDKIWFEETIIRPYARAERAMDRIKLALREGYVNLKKRYGGDFITKLYSENVTNEYTKMDAVRNYLWWNAGHDVPGLSTQDFDLMLEYVLNNEEIKNFADDIFKLINDNLKDTFITAIDVYPRPTDYWKQQDVSADIETMFKLMRPAIYQEFVENRYSVFNAENMNKIEAVYGGQFRRALEDIFFRMEEGVNRNQSQLNNPWLKWLNFATGNVMFVNVRSALLQSISATNFIELTGPNNLLNTLARVVDSKQWAADFSTLWNSTFLKERRSRGKIDIVQEEVIKSIRSEKDPFLKLAGMLQGKGYAPTRFVDSLAIAFGGAAYYRNLVNYYTGQGMNQVQAERTALRDFREKAESSQQSSRSDLISMEQASVMGRIFLTFQNVTMQYTRLGKKAFNDMKNGRRVKNPDGTFKSLTDSRLEQAWTMAQFFVYQNILFQGLQSAALLLMGLGEGDEVDEKRKVDYLNRAIDSILRGTGILGGALSVVKNIGIELARGNRRDLDVKVLEISPTISTKFRKAAKIINGVGSGKYKDVLVETPSFLYGLPTDRVARLLAQLEAAVDLHDQGYKSYERILMGLGWSTYDFGLPKPPTILDEINLDKNKNREDLRVKKR